MQQPSVLLVEDDAFQRKAAETYLMKHDLKVIAVENGAQMRRQISRAMPDLVLLDVQLPGQEDGFALARWLRENSTKVGIIMLTAAGDAVDKVLGSLHAELVPRAERPCLAPHITKPVDRGCAIKTIEPSADLPPASHPGHHGIRNDFGHVPIGRVLPPRDGQ